MASQVTSRAGTSAGTSPKAGAIQGLALLIYICIYKKAQQKLKSLTIPKADTEAAQVKPEPQVALALITKEHFNSDSSVNSTDWSKVLLALPRWEDPGPN